MGPANSALITGKVSAKLYVCVAAGLVASGLVLLGLVAGLRGSASGLAPGRQVVATPAAAVDALHGDAQLAARQAAFAMSHLGAMRDEADLTAREPERGTPETKPHTLAALPRPTPVVRPAAPAQSVPAIVAFVPPVAQAGQAVAPAAATGRKPTTVFGVALPSPGKLVDRVTSLGESLTSLVRWR